MLTIRTHFRLLETGENFIVNGVIFKKVCTCHAINMHTMRKQAFKPELLVEVI